MNSTKLLAFFAGATLIAVTAGCGTMEINTNTNTNVATRNANTNANVHSNANMNTNANRKTVNANISRQEYEKDKQSFAEEAKSLGRTVGAGANDGWLWTKTRAVLVTTDDLRDSTINVDVENGVVTLSGTVATQAQKSKAEQVAKGVDGIKSVKNNLTVKANP
ncbi:MAG: BON domain-containing protein [bacterium]